MSLRMHPEVREQARNVCCECIGGEFVCATHVSLLIWHSVCVYLLVDVLQKSVCNNRCMCCYVYPSLHMHTSSFVGMCLGTEVCFSL